MNLGSLRNPALATNIRSANVLSLAHTHTHTLIHTSRRAAFWAGQNWTSLLNHRQINAVLQALSCWPSSRHFYFRIFFC